MPDTNHIAITDNQDMRHFKYVCLFPLVLFCWLCALGCPGISGYINYNTIFWANKIQFLILFFTCVKIIQNDNMNRLFYLLLAAYCLSQLLPLLAKSFSNNRHHYSNFLGALILQFIFLNETIKPFFKIYKMRLHVIILSIQAVLLSILIALPFWFQTIKLEDQAHMIYLINLLTICIYGYCLLRSDHPKGVYINPLMGFFFLFIMHTMLTETLSQRTQSHPLILQSFTIFYLLAFNMILLSRLQFMKNDFGRFYNYMLQNPEGLGAIQMQRYQQHYHITLIEWLQHLGNYRAHWVFAILFLIGLCIYFQKLHSVIFLYFLAILPTFFIIYIVVNRLFKQRSAAMHIIQRQQRRNS